MPEAELDLGAVRQVHVTNAGGAGMSAVATLFVERGHTVSGHDPTEGSPFLARLASLGVVVHTGDADAAGLPDGTDLVVVSTATPADHPHVTAARGRGTPVWHRSDALRALVAGRDTVAVAGTHGKTTTSALLATVLAAAGLDPGFVIGAGVTGLGRSATWGGSGPMVVEADESDGTFLALRPAAAVVTNVEPDHLEHWGGEAALRDAFVAFVGQVAGPTVLCLDDAGSAALAPHATDPVTYGTSADSAYRIDAITPGGTGVAFDLIHREERVQVALPLAPGEHNARNAAAALAVAHRLGVPLADGAAALAAFAGVDRRFEVRGEAGGVTFVDSYDHLPTEVAAALAAARSGPWRRVVCCFQPHRYSRTEALGRAFADAFDGADVLAVTDVYPAGEAPRPGVTGKLVVDAVLDAHPWRRVAWVPTLDDAVAYLRATLAPGDLCLTLGAGDLTSVPDRLLTALGGGAQ